jgi:hypothetical protein
MAGEMLAAREAGRRPRRSRAPTAPRRRRQVFQRQARHPTCGHEEAVEAEREEQPATMPPVVMMMFSTMK